MASSRSFAALACRCTRWAERDGPAGAQCRVRQGIPHVGRRGDASDVSLGGERASGEGRSAEREARHLAERDAAARDGRARVGHQGGGGEKESEHGEEVRSAKMKCLRKRGGRQEPCAKAQAVLLIKESLIRSPRMAAAGTTAHHRCALAGWAVSLVVSTFWIRFVVGCPVWPDVACGFVSHLIALSVLWLEPRLMIPIGLALMGVCVGLMLVDMAFDLVIIREGSVRLGPTTVTPGRCARPRVPGGRYRWWGAGWALSAWGAGRSRPCLARAGGRRASLRMHARACKRCTRAWTV